MKNKILVIEDDRAISELLCMNLEAAGYETVISAYGYRFSVMSVEDKVIKQVMIKKLAPEEKK